MPKITISGLPGADGDYLLDFSRRFTHRDWHLMKEIAGVRAGELEEALKAGDMDVILTLAVIALERAGRRDVSVDALMENAEITMDQTDAEKEAERLAEEEASRIPPVSAPSGRNETNLNESSSGDSTSNGSEDSQGIPLRAYGSPSLAASSLSGRET